MISLRSLTRRFGERVAVDGVSLEVAAGELVMLVGASGSGKTTLLRLVNRLIEPDAGSVWIDGAEASSLPGPALRRRIGYCFQGVGLFPHLTVAENVGFGIRRTGRRQVGHRVARALDLVALGSMAARYPHELSGGERQRVALARALAPEPSLLLLDEPFASLDPNLRGQLRTDVVNALRTTGTPAVVVTHDQREALAVGDRIAVMRAGRIEHLDTPTAVFHQPANRFVGTFLGPASFLPIRVGRGSPHTVLGPIAEPVNPGDLAMVRPDDVVFEPADTADAEIVAAEFRGETWCYTIRCADGTEVLSAASHLAVLPVGTRGRTTLSPGHPQIVVPAGS